MELAALRLHADRLDHHVRTAPFELVLQPGDDVGHLFEVHRLHPGVAPGEVEPVVDVVHRQNATCAEQPSGLHGEQAHRSAPEDHHRLAALDLAHLRALVSGGEDVAEEEDFLLFHVVRNLHRTDVRERNAHVLRLAALVAAGGVRVAVHAGREVTIRVGVLAVRRQPTGAVKAGAAGDVEGHDHAIAAAQVLHRGAHRFHRAGELVPEGTSDARIRDETVQQMQIRTANRGAGHLQDRVVLVLDAGIRFLHDL